MPSLIALSNLDHVRLWLSDFPCGRQQAAIAATASLLAYISYKAIDTLVVKPYFSPLRNLPGPEKVDSYSVHFVDPDVVFFGADAGLN